MPSGTSSSWAISFRRLRSAALVILREMPPPRAGVGHQHRIAAGERQIGGQRRALVAALFLDDLHQQDLAALDDFLDLVLAARWARGARAPPRAHRRADLLDDRPRPRRGRPRRLLVRRSSSAPPSRLSARRASSRRCRRRLGRISLAGRSSGSTLFGRPRPRRRRDPRRRPRRRSPKVRVGSHRRGAAASAPSAIRGRLVLPSVARCRPRPLGVQRPRSPSASADGLVAAPSAGALGAPRRRRLRRRSSSAPRRARRALPPRAAPAGRRPGSGSSRDGFR